MECQDYGLTRTLERENLNLNPLQRGGLLPADAREALYEFADGYSICDYCEGRLDQIKKPDIIRFLDDLADFIKVDVVRTVHGAREGKFAVMHAICDKGDTIIVDGNAHYTTHLSAERNQLKIIETPNTGYPTFEIKPETYREVLENAIDKTDIKLALLTHVDGDYGNLTDAKKIASTCKKLGVPLLLNCAYTMGRMPIDAKKIGADFIVGSGHKSMAASGPIGVLGMTNEWEDIILKRSERHEKKEIEMLGCTSRGAPIATLMASFPHVKERVRRWGKEVKKTRYFVEEMEKLGEIIQLGVKPKKHDLVRFETPIFDKIASSHPRRGFFLYEELKEKKIVGIKRGQTRWFKCSIYAMNMEQIKYIINAFKDIIKKYQA
ncbi:MAG TPA: O-phospho-L-seryl-tRNA:Cys-tRNA synthase [Methanothermobacter sp.]|nr:Sep-tRNA:Cys-tRNA synthase [Methanothermobacter sp. MT-2]HHW05464.1 O-phospho-L-seryl-tRNA:Cys-tRNA synthase [Methanothermobacter sp.]HOK73200.1 O-phospho-L-seryl-tRNA:Cys-tRNA synthase [Methanothermobacter sp.]HOL68852.1 O-phospho-L-seryl-tRNA:Cys-tRNA synthase [Methanothermobacter sp.]HPQ04745.1 O-phospho-L-seryl-tRNA:Cys-tRNA synthase [Methanothermobacter sp.]